jgi:hypothetical protein
MDELGKSFPAAEGMVDAEQNTKGGHVNENCLNCGTKLVDTFCQHCGQKDILRRQTLGDMLTNFISSFWSYEGKFFLTTKYLITKPGFLAVEYNAGRRESYYHPARMYVFISFVFFLIFFSLPDATMDQEMSREDIKELNGKLTVAQMDSLIKTLPVSPSDTSIRILTPFKIDSIESLGRKKKPKKKGSSDDDDNISINFFGSETKGHKSIQAYDSAQQALAADKRDGWFERRMTIRSIELTKKYKGKINDFGKDFWMLLKDNFSKMLFWLLPFFALLLKLFYVRRDYYYSEHLVLTIYYYNFFYLAGSIVMLVDLVPWLEWLGTLIGFWIVFYLLFAMKRMYNQSWRKTIVKYLLFSFSFFFLLMIALMITAMAILMTI